METRFLMRSKLYNFRTIKAIFSSLKQESHTDLWDELIHNQEFVVDKKPFSAAASSCPDVDD